MRRDWCCGTPIDRPHVDGCMYSPAGPLDYDAPVTVLKPRHYLGDGAYVEGGNWAGQVCVYTSDGLSRGSQVYLEIDMVDDLHRWVHRND